ncbi:MAG: multidrug efflux SMR transporter [Actinomycetota bacterium]|nr:multidrug efflux SMR transporter [Actinomycetota bacterium]
MLAWIYLGLAIVLEVAGTIALRYSDGLSKLIPSATVLVTYGISFWLLALTLRELEISLVYAVWAGIGTAAIALIGMAAMGEPVSALKIASIGLVIAGVIGLNLAGAS